MLILILVVLRSSFIVFASLGTITLAAAPTRRRLQLPRLGWRVLHPARRRLFMAFIWVGMFLVRMAVIRAGLILTKGES